MKAPLDEIAVIASTFPALRLLVLHGSRARSDAHATSDWDFAFLAHPGFDPDLLIAKLVEPLHTDDVDLADLDRASGLLRYKAASDGLPIHESEPGLFDQLRLDAISAWCDMAPVLGPAFEDRLARLR